MNRQGIALPLAVAILLGVSILAATALQVALADFQANRGARLATRALLAAEAGAQRTVATWASGPYGALTPGDSASTAWVSLPDGSRYRSVVLRVDDGTADSPLYRVRTEGRPSRTSTARRQLVTMVTGSAGADPCCDGAATVRGRLRVRAAGSRRWSPPASVDGRDHVPTVWAGFCPVPNSGVAGVHIEESRDLTVQRGAEVVGTPSVLEDSGIGADVVDVIGGTTYTALASGADLVVTSGARYRGTIGPSARNRACRTSDPSNWGAPEVPGSPCWDYLPVIHASGDLRLSGGGQGQGVLLVDGDLRVDSDFRFYGLVVVRGRVTLSDGATFTGGLIVANRANGRGTSQIRDYAVVRYSSCAVARAWGVGGGARFLPGRHWFEIP